MAQYDKPFKELHRKADRQYSKGEYQKALDILEASDLPYHMNLKINQIKVRSLWHLGRPAESTAAFLKYADYKAQSCNSDPRLKEFIGKRDYKGALGLIESFIHLDTQICPYLQNIESCSTLLRTRTICENKLSEQERVKGVVDKVKKLVKSGEYKRSLDAIEDSKLPVEEHHILRAKQIECLNHLGLHEEAYAGVIALSNQGYAMPLDLNQRVGNNLTSQGRFEDAADFYKSLIDNPHVSKDNKTQYRKLRKDALLLQSNRDRTKEDEGGHKEEEGEGGQKEEEGEGGLKEEEGEGGLKEEEEGGLKEEEGGHKEEEGGLKEGEGGQKQEEDDQESGQQEEEGGQKQEEDDQESGQHEEEEGGQKQEEDDQESGQQEEGRESSLEARDQPVHGPLPEEEETEIEVSLALKFFYGKFKGKVAQGTLNRQHLRSFIIVEQESRVRRFEELQGLGNEYIVRTFELFGEFPREVLVTEPLVFLDDYFKALRDSFLESGNVRRASWWSYIAGFFTPIFRDIVHALIYLDSREEICGDVTGSLYVTGQGHGKILPSMDKKKKQKLDVVKLIEKMKYVLTLPFDDDHNITQAYELPHELTRLLEFVTPDKMNVIPAFWLYNNPFFWNTQECVRFTKDFRVYMKENIFPESDFVDALNKGCIHDSGGIHICSGTKEEPTIWSTSINILLFQEILNAPSKYKIRHYNHSCPADLHRYSIACYGHINDDSYEKFRGSGVNYSEEKIEGVLRSFFPTMIVDMYEAIYYYALLNPLGEGQKEALKKWSSLYMAKKRGATLKPQIE